MKFKNVFTITAMLMVVLFTGCKKDKTSGVPPVVSSTGPENNAISIGINSKISATFSAVMDSTTITLANFTLQQGNVPVTGTVVYNGTTATFTPSGNLAQNASYTATITTGVKDKSGKSLANDYVWSFTTGAIADNTPPTVTLTDPLNNATGVARNKIVSVSFNEALDPITINAMTFKLQQGGMAVPGTVTYSGTTAMFTPTTILAGGIACVATITTDAKDLAGNALATNSIWSFTTGSTTSNLAIVNLGTAGNYVILAKTAITNISTSAVTGDLGLSPAAASYITGFSITKATGFATSAQVTGKIYAADMASPTPINLTTAVNNMLTAYTDAAGRPTPDFSELGTGNIGGKTLIAGLYKWTNSVTISTDVTISGGADDVWIFQIAGNLTMSSAKNIVLSGGAQAKNIFWQVAGNVTIGTTSHFEGIILSKTGITFQTGASFHGKALAQTAVVLDGNAVTNP